jgi:hypothetical protein
VEELMNAICFGGNRCEMIVLISTHRDKRVENAMDKAREIRPGKIIPLFADQLMQVGCVRSEEGEAKA